MAKESPLVLIVDDEPQMQNLVKMYCNTAGLPSIEAENATTAISLMRQHTVSIIILDWMLPDLSGVELCKLLRKTSNVPILMLTARGNVEDRVEGLYAGADDYLSKPFECLHKPHFRKCRQSKNEYLAAVSFRVNPLNRITSILVVRYTFLVLLILTKISDLFWGNIHRYSLGVKQ